MMAWLLGAKKVAGPASPHVGFAAAAPMTVAARGGGGGADGMMLPATAMPAEEHTQQQEQYVPNDDGNNAANNISANHGNIQADGSTSTRLRTQLVPESNHPQLTH